MIMLLSRESYELMRGDRIRLISVGVVVFAAVVPRNGTPSNGNLVCLLRIMPDSCVGPQFVYVR